MNALQKFVMLLFIIFVVSGCNSTDPNNISKHDIEIHLQSWFSNTPVKVFLNDSLMLSDTISTGSILAYASIIPVTLSEGEHKLHVMANKNAELEDWFEVNSTLYIGVHYDSLQSKISYIFQNNPFYYD